MEVSRKSSHHQCLISKHSVEQVLLNVISSPSKKKENEEKKKKKKKLLLWIKKGKNFILTRFLTEAMPNENINCD